MTPYPWAIVSGGPIRNVGVRRDHVSLPSRDVAAALVSGERRKIVNAPRRYARLAFAEPRRFAGRVTYETASDPISATGSKDNAPSPAR
jgi:hypothetical protein